MSILFDLHREPSRSLLAAAINKTVFSDIPAELVEPAMGVFRELVENGTRDQPSHKRSVLIAGMLSMVAATRAVAAVVPQVSTAMTAGVSASAIYHSPHLLDSSSALKGRKAPQDWTVGAELTAFYLIAFDIVTGQISRALYPRETPTAATPTAAASSAPTPEAAPVAAA